MNNEFDTDDGLGNVVRGPKREHTGEPKDRHSEDDDDYEGDKPNAQKRKNGKGKADDEPLLEVGPDGKPYEVWVAESLLVASRSRWKTFTFHLKRSCFGAGTKIEWNVAENMRMKPCKYCVPHWERLVPHDSVPVDSIKSKTTNPSKRRKVDDSTRTERKARPQRKKEVPTDWTSSEEDVDADSDRINNDSIVSYGATDNSFAAELQPIFLQQNIPTRASLSLADTYSAYSEDSATDDQSSSSAWSAFDEITIMPAAISSLHPSVSASIGNLPVSSGTISFHSSIDIFNAYTSPSTGSIFNPLAMSDLGWMDY